MSNGELITPELAKKISEYERESKRLKPVSREWRREWEVSPVDFPVGNPLKRIVDEQHD